MARYTFPDESQRLLFNPSGAFGRPLLNTSGTGLTVYSDEEATLPAAIVDLEGNLIADSRVVVDGNSMIPLFQGPTGATHLYVKADGSPRVTEITASSIELIEGGGASSVELLPPTISRSVPWSLWKQFGQAVQSTPFLDRFVAMFASVPDQPATATSPSGPLLLWDSEMEGALWLSLTGACIEITQTVTSHPGLDFEVVLIWTDADPLAPSSVPSDPMEFALPFYDISEPPPADLDSALPAQGMLVATPPVDAPYLRSIQVTASEGGLQPDPMMFAVIASISLYQGDRVLVPRLVYGEGSMVGINPPVVPEGRFESGPIFGSGLSMGASGQGIALRKYLNILDAEAGYDEIAIAADFGDPGEPRVTIPRLRSVIDLPLHNFAAVMGGAQFSIISDYRDPNGTLLGGVLAARLDLSAVGGPADQTRIAPFQVDPTSGEYVISAVNADAETGEVLQSFLVIPNLQIINVFGTGAEAILTGGTPTAPHHLTTKGYVDALLDMTQSGRVRKATKYGRTLGGKWALVSNPGFYETPDVGPLDREGIRCRARLTLLEPDFASNGDFIAFFEFLTQFRNDPDTWPYDQDNLELALTLLRSRIGFFSEDCLISTPFPVESGEYADGRFYTDDDNAYSGMDFTLGDAIELRYDHYFDNGMGRWVKRFFIRTTADHFNLAEGDIYETLPGIATDLGNSSVGLEDYYWKLVAEKIGPEGQVGSIADAGLPFGVGYGGGLLGVEKVQLSHIDSAASSLYGMPGGEELVLDFQSKDIDPDTGIGTSLLIAGQTFTPHERDGYAVAPLPVIDNSPSGLWSTEQRIRTLEP